MANRLAGSISPYLRAHADNPVDWWPWGPEALAEAVRRDVPLFISIGYATCHWCHVMARESFTDPVVADYLNEHFVAIKVDREEHPEVDASYLAQAGAFTRDLGWPLSIFADRAGVAFFAATYLPPQPIGQVPAFRQVLEAATEAWTERRGDIAGQAAALIEALAESADRGASPLPDAARLNHVAVDMASYEDPEQGGFGTAPKFPVVPALQFLLDNGSTMAVDLAERTLVRMAQSPLRDSIDGGFFRYATQRNWSEPHYERMLYDNALLLKTYAGLAILRPSARAVAEDSARGIARFLTETMAVDGGFASAQDSESTIDGRRVEGEYYTVPRAERELLEPPPLDAKVLTGWNGLAIEALAVAGFRLGVPEWIAVAAEVADGLLADHVLPSGLLVRASLAGEASEAVATLEDYGMFAGGLLALAEVTGEVRFAVAARGLIDACLTGDGSAFTAPGGADPVLAASGLAVIADPSEGAYPSGLSAIGLAAMRLYRLTDDRRYLDAVTASCASVIALALDAPISFGATLSIAQQLATPVRQLLVVGDRGLASVAAEWRNLTATIATGTPFQTQELEAAGFELYAARRDDAAYLCEAFSCRLPITDPDTLREALVL